MEIDPALTENSIVLPMEIDPAILGLDNALQIPQQPVASPEIAYTWMQPPPPPAQQQQQQPQQQPPIKQTPLPVWQPDMHMTGPQGDPFAPPPPVFFSHPPSVGGATADPATAGGSIRNAKPVPRKKLPRTQLCCGRLDDGEARVLVCADCKQRGTLSLLI